MISASLSSENRKTYLSDGLVILPTLKSKQFKAVLDSVHQLIHRYFFEDIAQWQSLSTDDFYAYTYECQQKIISTGFQDSFIESNYQSIIDCTQMKEIYHESTIFLRAIRPTSLTSVIDNLSFHRETMFTDSPLQTSHAHNIWFPLTETTPQSAVKYYPSSHLIPDEDLDWSEDSHAPRVERGSFGHKLGMLYKPKSIRNLPRHIKAKNILPSLNEFALFSAMTLHGAGVNNSSSIRLSLTMATIDPSHITDNKSYTASGGLPHYVPFTPSHLRGSANV